VLSEIREDVHFYTALRHPGRRCGALRTLASCLTSRGLLVLEVQRLDRYYNALRQRLGWTPRTLLLKMILLLGRFLAIVLAKSDVSANACIAGGVYLSDGGHLIVAPRRLGSGSLIHQRVTIGAKAGCGPIKPTIGENVWIGPDCVIYGDITIGDGATVLPGTVLSMNVPPGAVAAGNPATIIAREFDNAPLRRSLRTDFDRAQFAPSPCILSGT
jgi:serine acetyltransferase